MNNKIVSVVIPCYNCQDTIQRAIASVFSQSYKNWELILVDNNSKDDTLDLLNEYKRKYPGQVHVISEKKPGAPAARNRGLYSANGPIIQFLDADDELLPEKIEKQVQLIEPGNRRVDFVFGSSVALTQVGGVEKRSIREIITDDVWLALINSKLGITSANIFQKDALVGIGGWDEELKSSQEYDLMFRLLANGFCNVGADTSLNTIIYKGEGSISRGNSSERVRQIIDQRIVLRLKIKEHLLKSDLLTNERNKAINDYIYKELFRHRTILPKYVLASMRKLGMKLPTKELLRTYLAILYNTFRARPGLQ